MMNINDMISGTPHHKIQTPTHLKEVLKMIKVRKYENLTTDDILSVFQVFFRNCFHDFELVDMLEEVRFYFSQHQKPGDPTAKPRIIDTVKLEQTKESNQAQQDNIVSDPVPKRRGRPPKK